MAGLIGQYPVLTGEVPATCVHDDGVEHPASNDLVWDPSRQCWIRMYSTCR